MSYFNQPHRIPLRSGLTGEHVLRDPDKWMLLQIGPVCDGERYNLEL